MRLAIKFSSPSGVILWVTIFYLCGCAAAGLSDHPEYSPGVRLLITIFLSSFITRWNPCFPKYAGYIYCPCYGIFPWSCPGIWVSQRHRADIKAPVLNCRIKDNPHDCISESRTVPNTHFHYHQRHYHPHEMHKFALMTMAFLMLVLSVAAAQPRALKQAKIKRDDPQGVHVARDADHRKPKPSKTPPAYTPPYPYPTY